MADESPEPPALPELPAPREMSELPELTLDLLEPGFRFPPIEATVSDRDLEAYAAALGRDRARFARTVPPGFAGLLARRSYLGAHRMPPGGVLLAQTVRWRRPAAVGVLLRLEAAVRSRERRGGRDRATIDTRLGQAGDEGPVAEIATTIAWPR